ncbi:MAG: hypothetical protein SGPRY_013018 [Prymnesium sp.]
MAEAVAARLKRPAAADRVPPPKRQLCEEAAAGSAALTLDFREGELVMGNFKGMGDWDEALVVGVMPNGNYVLEYTDEGLIEEDVPASRITGVDGADAFGSFTSTTAVTRRPEELEGEEGRDAIEQPHCVRPNEAHQLGDEDDSDADNSDSSEEHRSFHSAIAEFVAAKKWRGCKAGYCFKADAHGLGYYKDVPLLQQAQEAERRSMAFTAPQLANWAMELYSLPPSVHKLDRYMELFDLSVLRVRSLASSTTPLFASLFDWFEASKRMLKQEVSAGVVQVTLRVFLEPKQTVRQGIRHTTFSIDWLRVEGSDFEP